MGVEYVDLTPITQEECDYLISVLTLTEWEEFIDVRRDDKWCCKYHPTEDRYCTRPTYHTGYHACSGASYLKCRPLAWFSSREILPTTGLKINGD